MNEPYIIRGSRTVLDFINPVFSLLACGYFLYALLWKELPFAWAMIGVGFAAYFSAVSITHVTMVITLDKGWLNVRSLFIHRRVNLEKLRKAQQYKQHLGRYPSFVLRLEDDQGNFVRFIPTSLDRKRLWQFGDMLHPYLFRHGVDKNFVSLWFTSDKFESYHLSVSRGLRGVFLYVLLPCIVITLLIILWAIVTKQPAFR